MNRFVPIVSLLLLIGSAIVWVQRSSQPRGVFPAPDFTLSDLNGSQVRLAELRGQVVFLNLWATWCPPCRTEMPSMDALYRRFRDRGLAMLAVSQDVNGAEAVRPFIEEIQPSFSVLLDPEGRLSTRYGVTGYPETFVIDRTGNVVHHHVGPAEWDSPAVLSFFEQLLAQPVPTPAEAP